MKIFKFLKNKQCNTSLESSWSVDYEIDIHSHGLLSFSYKSFFLIQGL